MAAALTVGCDLPISAGARVRACWGVQRWRDGPMPPLFAFDNSYARLPARFYARCRPTPVAAPALVRVNHALAASMGLDAARLEQADGVAVLAGNVVPEGSEPIALAYAGHQFGGFSPQLGDGRAILLGEMVGADGRRRDIQLKGSGPTPYSRRGDGRAGLGPVLREYLVSEAMAALGVPTARVLAAVTTGEAIARERMVPGAVLTRVAASHIRVGTFEYFAAQGDTEAVRLLADYAIARHDPDAAAAGAPYRAFLDGVVARQARLVAHWMLVGFIHGVMNTDNTAVSGETIDYGPCAFMDSYDPATVFSSIDHGGRYAYGNQPPIALWNLTRLAECLLPLLDPVQEAAVEVAETALGAFRGQYQAAFAAGMAGKLGFASARAGDDALVQDLLGMMQQGGADFTLTFRSLCGAAEPGADPGADAALSALFAEPASCAAWLGRWRARLAMEPDAAGGRAAGMRRVNPAFIARNHQVEAALQAAIERQDFGPFETLLAVLADPYADQPEHAAYSLPPHPDQRVLQTFCGT